MKLRCCIGLCLVCLGASTKATEPLVSFGPDIPVFLSMAGTVRYDDNIYLQKADKTSDTLYILMPGVDLHTSGGTGKGDIAFSEQFIRYGSHSSLNSNLASLLGSASYEGGVSQISARASYQEMDQSNLNLRSSEESVRRNLTSASVNAGIGLAGKTSAGLGLLYDKTEYPKVGYTDDSSWSIPLDLYYALTPKTDLSVGYRYRRTTTEGDRDNTKDNFFNVGARGQFTPKLSGQVRTGVTERSMDRGGTDHLLGLEADLAYALTPKTTLSLQANNDYTNSALGTSERVTSVGVNGDFALSQRWSVGGGVSYENSHYLDAAGRHDRFWVGNLGATCELTANASLQLSYVYRKNASNVNVEFAGSVTSLSASVRF